MKWDIKTLPLLITGALAIVDLSIFDESITKPEDCPNFRYACPSCPSGQQCVYPNNGGCEGAGIPTCQAYKGCFGQICLMRALPCPKECPFFCKYNGPPCCPFIGQPVCQPQCQTSEPCQVTKCPAECPDDCFYPNAPTCCPRSGKAVCKNKRNDVLDPPVEVTDEDEYSYDSGYEDNTSEDIISDNNEDNISEDIISANNDDDIVEDIISDNNDDDIVEEYTDLEGTTITEWHIPNTYNRNDKKYDTNHYRERHDNSYGGRRNRGVYQDYERQNRGRYYGNKSGYSHQNGRDRYNRHQYRNNGYYNNYPDQYRDGCSRKYPKQQYKGHPVQPQPNWTRKPWNYKDQYLALDPASFPGPEAAIDYFPIPGYTPDDPKTKSPYGAENCEVGPNPAAVDYRPITVNTGIEYPYHNNPSIPKANGDYNPDVLKNDVVEINQWRDGNELPQGYPKNTYMSPPFYVDRDIPVESEKETLLENAVVDNEDELSDGSNLDLEHPLSPSSKLHQMCSLVMIPCPPECPDDCIYPKNLPCPFTKPPSCPPKKGYLDKEPLSKADDNLSDLSSLVGNMLGDILNDVTSITEDVSSIETFVTQPIDIDIENHHAIPAAAAAAAANKLHVVSLKREPALPLFAKIYLKIEIIFGKSSVLDHIVTLPSDESF